MHNKSFSITSIVVTVIVVIIENVYCTNNEEQFLSTSQSSSNEKEIVVDAFINTTPATNSSVLPYNVNLTIQSKNDSGFKIFDEYKQKLLVAPFDRRGKVCLDNVKRCMQEDVKYHPTLNQLTHYLWSSNPLFDLSTIKGISKKCRKHTLQYLHDLKEYKLWALKMYDANAKIPSGILNGNINQLGDFDECLSVISDNQKVKGQYCLTSMQVEIPESPYLAALHRLVHSHYAFKSSLEDPGHRVPRFSSINWAVCSPKSCTPKDIEIGLKEYVDTILNGTDFKMRMKVDPAMCQHSESWTIPWSTILVGAFFGFVLLLILAATLYDILGGTKHEIFLAFSLSKNIQSLVSVNKSSDDIIAIHGIRFLNTIMALVVHKAMAAFFVPYTNRTQMSELVGKPWTAVARAASLYTDPFIMISGTLTTYSLLGKLQRDGKINVSQEYISRLFRIIPAFGALILFCTFILPWVNSGPFWNQVVTEHSHKCKQYWWRNLLFIHNYFGFKDMCLTDTHHVGIDTQLFFTAPIIIPFLYKWPKRGIFTLVIVAVVSTVMRYYVTYSRKLSSYVYFGASIEQLFSTADNMYILPAYRATVYIMGILLGYLLRNCKSIQLTMLQIQIGNAIALLCFCVSFIEQYFMGSMDYIYNPRDAAWFAAFTPIPWCISWAWLIFTTHIGQSTLLGQLFSLEIFSITTKISYALYLVQIPVFFYNIGIIRAPETYFFLYKNVDITEFVWIFIYAIMLTLLVEMPFQTIRNVMLKKNFKEIKEVNNFTVSKQKQQ